MSKSKIFLFLCLSFIGGVFIRSLANFSQLWWLGILILGIVISALFWPRKQIYAVLGFCFIFIFFGAWRFNQANNPENSIRQFNDQGRMVFQGKIIDEPDVRADNIRYKIAASKVRIQDKFSEAKGVFLLVAKKYPAHQYGEILEIFGKLKTPQSGEDFDYQKYLAKDDVYSIIYYPEIKTIAQNQGGWLKQKLFALKSSFENSIGLIISEPQAAFLTGLLLGEKRGLSADLTAAFGATGTTHIIALSGYNISIIAFALISVFNFFALRRTYSFWLSILLIVLFVVMTGASASVVRAAVMGILILVARQSGRLYTIRNALIFAGALMIYLNPKVLVFDLGFQLSFAATLGLIYVSPIFEGWIIGDRMKNPSSGIILNLKEILIATLSAQIAVLPLLVINFGQLSLIAPLANLLILLVIPLTMFWGFAAGVLGIFWLGAAKVIGWLAWIFLSYEIKVVEILAKIPWAAVEFKWSWREGGIYYVILIWLVLRFGRKQKTLIEKTRV